jgi:hypothetical protein
MRLALSMREHALASLRITRNYNTVYHICLDFSINTDEYLQRPAYHFTLSHKLLNQNVSFTHALLSTQYVSFGTLSVVRRNTTNDSNDHNATCDTDKED